MEGIDRNSRQGLATTKLSNLETRELLDPLQKDISGPSALTAAYISYHYSIHDCLINSFLCGSELPKYGILVSSTFH